MPLMRPAILALALATMPPFASATAVEAAASPRFPILEFRVLGNSVLPTIDVERAVYPFLGEDKSFADVESARGALEAAYRARDFGTVFVDIPEQAVDDGVVRLRVTEGRLRVARIGGARYYSERRIRETLPSATPGAVPHIAELQKELAAVNSAAPDRAVVPVLKAGPVPGTVDLALNVDDHLPVHGSVEVNNEYTTETDHLRAAVALSAGNVFTELDSLSLNYQATPRHPGQVGVLAASYTTAPSADGLRGSLSYIHSSSSVATVAALGVLGKGEIVSGRLSLPLAVAAGSSQAAFVGADYKHFRDTIAVDSSTSLVTPISYVNFTAGYTGDWRGAARQWSFATSANLGIRGIVNDPVEFEGKRYLARPNYFYLRADGALAQALPAGFVLRARVAGQYAADPIISNENFVIAGADGVRGYLEAEELGDAGIKASLQLNSPPWMVWRAFAVRGLAFFDTGRTHVLDPLDSQPGSVLLRSYGAGLELAGSQALSGNLTWARPLANAATTRAGESRWLFAIRSGF
jgi:hemolysin activation/secretion protein